MDLLNTTFDCSKYASTKEGGIYVKYFVAFDVLSVHTLRIQENINDEYDDDDGCVLLEHNQIDYYPGITDYFKERFGIDSPRDVRLFISKCMERIPTPDILKAIVDYDADTGFEQYDCCSEYCTIDEMVNERVLRDGLDNLSSLTI